VLQLEVVVEVVAEQLEVPQIVLEGEIVDTLF
jgi:hypothetical protein